MLCPCFFISIVKSRSEPQKTQFRKSRWLKTAVYDMWLCACQGNIRIRCQNGNGLSVLQDDCMTSSSNAEVYFEAADPLTQLGLESPGLLTLTHMETMLKTENSN